MPIQDSSVSLYTGYQNHIPLYLYFLNILLTDDAEYYSAMPYSYCGNRQMSRILQYSCMWTMGNKFFQMAYQYGNYLLIIIYWCLAGIGAIEISTLPICLKLSEDNERCGLWYKTAQASFVPLKAMPAQLKFIHIQFVQLL